MKGFFSIMILELIFILISSTWGTMQLDSITELTLPLINDYLSSYGYDYYGYNDVMKRLTEDFINERKSWINPHDKILVGENTPVYIISNNSKIKFVCTIGSILPLINKKWQRYTREYKNLYLPSTLSTSLLDEKKLQITNNTMYPEILVIVDKSLYDEIGNMKEVVAYLLPFWHEVDMMFRSLRYPAIRLNIAGIILSKNDSALPYIKDARYGPPENVDIVETLDATVNSTYSLLNSAIQNDAYDIVITMTKRLLQKCAPNDIPLASFFTGACKVKGTRQYNHGFIHDNGGFAGVEFAVNELAHLLGVADHENFIYNHKFCYEFDNHLLYRNVNPEMDKIPLWSLCSAIQIQNFASSAGSNCLRNKPNVGQLVNVPLPNEAVDKNNQCQVETIKGAIRSVKMKMRCYKLQCSYYHNNEHFLKSWDVIFEREQAITSGLKCGNKKICLYSQCFRRSELYEKKY